MAGLLVSVTGASGNGQPTTKVGTSTGFSEIPGRGTAANWQGLAAMGSPSGAGWLLDSTILQGQQIIAGTWTPKTRAKISVGTATADMYVNAYKYVGGAYTLIGTCSLLAQALGTVLTAYNFSPTVLSTMQFGGSGYLYIDVWYNVTVNNSGSGAATIGFTNSNSASLGRAGEAEVDTPGFTSVPLVTLAGGRRADVRRRR